MACTILANVYTSADTKIRFYECNSSLTTTGLSVCGKNIGVGPGDVVRGMTNTSGDPKLCFVVVRSWTVRSEGISQREAIHAVGEAI